MKPAMPSMTVELVARAPLSPRVSGLTFMASAPFARAAGQHVLLFSDPQTQHPFSVASPFEPGAPGRFEVAVSHGTSAAVLLELPLGTQLSARGPSGALTWQGELPSLFVGTGTGLAPLRAIVKEQLGRSEVTPLYLIFGCRSRQEELWGDELRRLAAEQPRFRFVPVYSQAGPAATELRGRVQQHVVAAVRALGPRLRAYLCGHPPMVAELRAALTLEHGLAEERILSECY